MLLWLACAPVEPTDTPVEDTPVADTAEPDVVDVPLVDGDVFVLDAAGILGHQVAYRGDGSVWGTYSMAWFQDAREMTLAAFAFAGTDECVLADPPGLTMWAADKDVGSSISLGVGGDALTLRRTADWGDVTYELEGAGATRGTTEGSALTVMGVESDVHVPAPIVLSDLDGTWEDFLDSGTLRLAWTPAHRGFIEVGIDAWSADGGVHLACGLADDGAATVTTGWTDLRAHDGAELYVARAEFGLVDVPDVGVVLVSATTDVQLAWP